MMKIISLMGRKGGGGKTSFASHLCGEYLAMGLQVVALDADPQGSLTKWAGMGQGLLSHLVKPVEASNIDEFRAAIEPHKHLDVVLIDTPPGFHDAGLWSCLISDIVVLPVGPSPLDIFAASETLDIIKAARNKRHSKKPKVLLVPNRVRAGTSTAKSINDALASLKSPVGPSIGLREPIAVSALHGLTVAEYAPSSLAREEFTALAKHIEGMK